MSRYRKRQRVSDSINWSNWTSPSALRSTILNDGIRIGSSGGFSQFEKMIMDSGTKFEESVFTYMKSLYSNFDIQTVATHFTDYKSDEKYLLTKKLMNENVDIIYQGVLRNYKYQIFGIADLLVHRDVVNKICGGSLLDEEVLDEELCDYYVIDIKNKNLEFKANGVSLVNSGSWKYIKNQIYMYSECVAEMRQKVGCGVGFVMGRSSKIRGQRFSNVFHKLGRIDFQEEGIDKYFQSTLEVYREGTGDFGTDVLIEKIRRETNLMDLMDFYYCGIGNILFMYRKGIHDWKNIECNAFNLGITSPGISGTLNTILCANRIKDEFPAINFNLNFDWIKPSDSAGDQTSATAGSIQKHEVSMDEIVDVYLDIETINTMFLDDFSKLPKTWNENIIYMIGFGIRKGMDWKQYTFSVGELNLEKEKKMMDTIAEMFQRMGTVRIFHWGSIEKTMCGKYWKSDNIIWVDVCADIKKGLFAIKGSTNYKLKNVGNAMKEHGFVRGDLWEGIDSGNDSIVEFCNMWNMKGNDDYRDSAKYAELVKYNSVDCKIMYEIVNAFRLKFDSDEIKKNKTTDEIRVHRLIH